MKGSSSLRLPDRKTVCYTGSEDTLKDDKYGDVKMTVQVNNPPYSLKWSVDKKFEDDPRYSGAGKLAPESEYSQIRGYL